MLNSLEITLAIFENRRGNLCLFKHRLPFGRSKNKHRLPFGRFLKIAILPFWTTFLMTLSGKQ